MIRMNEVTKKNKIYIGLSFCYRRKKEKHLFSTLVDSGVFARLTRGLKAESI